ncbi:MAG: hypothetical protein E7427_07300 [Ruminococcaceae bacterium]|nr:hypothetical protein [Oscillospiraceae bacterium]
MTLFEAAGKQNTDACIRIALDRAAELDCPVVAASTLGVTALALLSAAAQRGFARPIVIVRGCSGKNRQGVNLMPPEAKAEILARGGHIVTAAHALSAGERGISTRHRGAYPLEIMAETLRMFGHGTKVCVEAAVMALNADELPFGRPVVAIGGTHRGADTAVVLTPSYSASILDTVVHEILCKPFDIRNPDPSTTFD